ncbi:MAG: hypothetical protein PF570_10200 [Candidatus Cloacimonetes bacterium]|jgi:ribosomal protein L31|nr:hypothetical protein [Candidatus Cloacimonadota bacterium]
MRDIQKERRYGDARMDKLETTIRHICNDVTDIKTKIYNGFEKSIKNTEARVTRFENRYEIGYNDLVRKVDKILFLWISGSISVVVTIIAAIILLFVKGAL